MSVSRATASVFSFPLIDASNRPARKSGATSIVTQVSKDGGPFVNTTNSAVEIATSSGRYSLLLTAAETAAASVHVIASASGCDPTDIIQQTYGLADGVVTGSPSSTSITASAQAETSVDHWKGAFIRFTSGSLSGQVRQVVGYSTGVFTVYAFTSAPAVGDRYVIVNG